MANESELVTVSQAATLLEIDRQSVYQAINKGRLKAKQYGIDGAKRWLLKREDVLAYSVNRRKQDAGKERR